MKKFAILSVLVQFVVNGLAQTPELSFLHQDTQTDYLKKSKSQRTAAWILAGAGSVLMTVGFVVGVNEGYDAITNVFGPEPEKSSNTGEILFFTGLATAAASVPFFILSAKNKRKAVAAVSFKLEQIRNNNGSRARLPVVAISLAL